MIMSLQVSYTCLFWQSTRTDISNTAYKSDMLAQFDLKIGTYMEPMTHDNSTFGKFEDGEKT